MTYFLDFRTRSVGGGVVDPRLYEGDGTADPPALTLIPTIQWRSVLDGKNLLFAAHGFNVSRTQGTRSLGLLDGYLGLGPLNLFIGILWPGDSWLPIVDYPFEGEVAIDCGRRLADFCNRWCVGAQSLSFLSHSLGARLVLEATTQLARQAQSVCLAAGAINRDCLTAEYSGAAANAGVISLLASHRDDVLKIAFSIGDPLSVLLHDDHTAFRAALGYDGPSPPAPQPVRPPWQIPDQAGYGHGDYLPPSAVGAPPNPQWPRAADFMKRAFLNQPQSWP